MSNLEFSSFNPDLLKEDKEVKQKLKTFLDNIKVKELREKFEDYFSFLSNQDKSYFELRDEKGNIKAESQYSIDRKKFLSENTGDGKIAFNKESFDTIVTSIIQRRYLASYVEDGAKKDNSLDIVKEKELKEKFEEFMKIEPKTYDKLLSLPRAVRLDLCTKNHTNIDELKAGKVQKIEFDFKFGEKNINKEIYLNTTAGQLLPAEVRTIVKNGVVYKRSGLKGEFFTDFGKRLTIHQNTQITISKFEESENIKKEEDKIKKDLNIENQEKISLSDKIRLEASLRGIEPDFAVIAFKDTLEKEAEEKREYVLENMLTEFDRVRGMNKYSKNEPELLLLILNKYNGDKFEEKAKQYRIDEKYIKSFKEKVNNFNKYHKNISTSIDFEKYNGAAAKIMGFALQAYKNKDILGAEHCTDWVDKVFIATTGKSVYSSHTIFNGVKKTPSGTGLGVKEYASKDMISQIKGGDHLILDKPRHGVYGIGRTHSVIALETPKDGIVKVVSYPNSKIPPRVEYYDLYGKGRTGKNGKPIRIQRAQGEGLSSVPRPKNIKEDNLSNLEREKRLSKAPEYLKNLIKKYFPKDEYENALLTCYGESSYNKNAVNVNRDKYSSTDRGLFQINDHFHGDKYRGENIFDPEVNVRVAAQIFKEAGNSWKPWHAATKIGLI